MLGTDAIAGPPGHYRLRVPVDATRFAVALFSVGATDDRAGDLRALRLLTEAEEIATDRKLPHLQADIDRIRTEAPLTRT